MILNFLVALSHMLGGKKKNGNSVYSHFFGLCAGVPIVGNTIAAGKDGFKDCERFHRNDHARNSRKVKYFVRDFCIKGIELDKPTKSICYLSCKNKGEGHC